MKTYKSRVIIWTASLMAGFGLVAASLIVTISDSSELSRASHNKLYFSGKLLPDHSFYPALAAVERARLMATPIADKPQILISLARLRMEAAQDLADKNEPQLAEKTFYKSHLYLIKATEMIKHQKQWPYVADLSSALNEFAELCPALKEQIQPGDATLFEQMKVENQMASQQVAELLFSEH